jgi:hypothetical protein
MFDLDDFDKKPKKKKEREMEMMQAMMKNKLKFDQDEPDSDESLVDWGDVDENGAAGAIERWKELDVGVILYENCK